MSYAISRFLGLVDVVEKGDVIRVTGIPGDVLEQDIAKIWKTNKINANMFTELGKNHFVFPKFFAVEVQFMLNMIKEVVGKHHHMSTIDKILKGLSENTWLKSLTEPHPDILDFEAIRRNFTLTPLPHQVDFFTTYNTYVPRYNLRGYMLASAPGTGKTFMDMALADALHADVTIVISPKNAVSLVWAKSYATLFKKKRSYWTSLMDVPLESKYSAYIFHYEQLDRAIKFADTLKNKKVVVVLDESHNFNEQQSARTDLIVTLCRNPNVSYCVWASGSPIKALGTEAIPFLKSIDPLFTPDAEARFAKIFGGDAQRALEILNHRIGLVTYKVPKSVIQKTKPITEKLYVKLKNSERYTIDAVRKEMQDYVTERLKYYDKIHRKQREIYDAILAKYRAIVMRMGNAEIKEFEKYLAYMKDMEKNYDPVVHKEASRFCKAYEKNKMYPRIPAADKKQFADVRSVILYVNLKVQGEALGRILGARRAELSAELAKHCDLAKLVSDGQAKTIVYSPYVEAVRVAASTLKSQGFKPIEIYADTNSRLKELVDAFASDPDLNPVCATYKSLSTAVPMIMANQIIMLGVPYRQYEYEQTVARVDRLGQLLQVYVFEVFLDTGKVPNISTRNDEIINWSREQVGKIMGDEFSGAQTDVIVRHFSDPEFNQENESGIFGFIRRLLGISKDI